MAAPAAYGVETEAICGIFSTVPEIESIFLLNRGNTCLITIIVPSKDYNVENRIYELQLELMDKFENCLFDFDIIARAGRKATDIITPIGDLIFDRTTA